MNSQKNCKSRQGITDKAFKAMREAVTEVIAVHKKLRLPLYVEENGKIKELRPWAKK